MKRNLKYDFFHIHLELTSLCGLGDFFSQPESEYEVNGKFNLKKFNESELEHPLKQNSIENLGKFDSEYASFFQSKVVSLGNTLNRFGKFLEPSIQCSLMDLEDYLDTLNYYLLSHHFKENDKKEFMLQTVKKIGIEAQKLTV